MRGPVSLAVYTQHDEPKQAASTLVEQAVTALEAGFHGVTISEHHADFPGYVPAPTLVAASVLGATSRGWVAPNPLLLPLRPVPLVMEEVAWLAATAPGRVAAGVAAGYSPQDFEVFGLDRSTANRTFRAQLREWRDLLDNRPADRAVADLLPGTPVLVATGGPRTAALAARNGFGLMLPPAEPDRNRAAAESHRAGGGPGPRWCGQWVWLGEPPRDGIEALSRAYNDTDAQGNRMYAPRVLHDTDPDALAGEVVARIEDLGLTGINLRVHLPGVDVATTTEQIRAVGREIVPRLERALR